MKLIRCTVRGFGNLREQNFTFNDGLNIFLHKNGWGKTTLSVFLKAMLYGMGTSRATDLSENERKRFMPWDKLPCAGMLVYEANGHRYRVERTFSAKTTGADDTCVVYDEATGAVCTPDRPLGELLFGVDADAFERTVFLSERNLTARSGNPTVKAKLADLIGTDADLGSFDATLHALDERRRELYINRRGSTALINQLDERIRELSGELGELEREIAHLSALDTDEQQFRAREAALRAQYEVLRRESDGLRRPEDEQLFVSQYQAACNDEHAAQQRYNETRALFGEVVPSEGILLQAKAAHGRIERATHEQAAQNEVLSAFFKRSTSDDELAQLGQALHTPRAAAWPIWLCAMLTLASLPCALWITPLLFIVAGICAVLTGVLLWHCNMQRRTYDQALHLLRQYPTASSQPQQAYSELCAKFSDYKQVCASAASEESDDRRLLRQLAQQYELPIEDEGVLDRLLPACTRLPMLEQALAQAHRRTSDAHSHMQAFRQGLDPERRQTLDTALRATQQELELCRMEEQRVRGERASLEQKSVKREHLTAQLSELYAKKDTYQTEHTTIVRTMEYLRRAADSLTARYTKPAQDGFERYRRLLDGDSQRDYHLSVDFELRRDEDGELKPLDAYSHGTRDMHALALRLALVDALFEKEVPFLILDDPFTALDDERLTKALDMLHRLGEQRQILYFTCTRSRVPGDR